MSCKVHYSVFPGTALTRHVAIEQKTGKHVLRKSTPILSLPRIVYVHGAQD